MNVFVVLSCQAFYSQGSGFYVLCKICESAYRIQFVLFTASLVVKLCRE